MKIEWVDSNKKPVQENRYLIKMIYDMDFSFNYKPFTVIYFAHFCPCSSCGWKLPQDAKNTEFKFKMIQWAELPLELHNK